MAQTVTWYVVSGNHQAYHKPTIATVAGVSNTQHQNSNANTTFPSQCQRFSKDETVKWKLFAALMRATHVFTTQTEPNSTRSTN